MHRRREDEEVVDVDVGEEREKGSGVGGTAVELPRATPLAGDGAAVGLDGSHLYVLHPPVTTHGLLRTT